jgi:hypothetical protein
MAPRMRFELMSDKAHRLPCIPASEETGFQDRRRNPGLATSAQFATVGNAF